MKQDVKHISSFSSLAIVLTILLVLTTISVLATGFHLGPLTVVLALVIASTKVFIVLTQFMHLKFENLFLRMAVTGVFVLFALVVIITFVDYYFR